MALPPGFDMSQMQEILNNPQIREMAEKMSQDPAFQAITQQFANMGLAPGGGGDAAGGAATRDAASGDAAGAAAGGAGGMPGMPDPEQYMKAMQGIMQNEAFAKMAEDIGKKMFESDPQLKSMVQTMEAPEGRSAMEAKMAALKEDPELKHIIEELETGGPAAMMKYWNDAETMQKLGKAFGDMPGLGGMFGGGAAGAGGMPSTVAEEEDEEEAPDSALLNAAMEGDLDAIKQCIADAGTGFDVNEKDNQGRTALHFACGYGEVAVVKELLSHQASVTATDSDENTPLHYAAGYGETECVKLLLDHGAGLTERNKDGKTALEVAKLNEQEEIAALLQEKEGEAYL